MCADVQNTVRRASNVLYGRTVVKLGKSREERVEHLAITASTTAEAARFSQAWNTLQGDFVDNPQGVVV
jgi:hypothetical protein